MNLSILSPELVLKEGSSHGDERTQAVTQSVVTCSECHSALDFSHGVVLYVKA